MKPSMIHGALFGVAIGDALGVPVEFQDREQLSRFPVTDMREYGSHGQPKGTWSDDSSLTFCLADGLLREGYNLQRIANNFVLWRQGEFWTPHGRVFDIGIATSQAIHYLEKGMDPICAGGISEMDNGNGSLMRILPLAFSLKGEQDLEIIYKKVKEVSSITHAHFRSVFACFIYIIFALEIVKTKDMFSAYINTKKCIGNFLKGKDYNLKEVQLFDRILIADISSLQQDEVQSSGYVLHSLEASLWCLLTSKSYKETVLKAVNLGEDTDTTAAITGGLAGILYGYTAIPSEWIEVLARKNDIYKLCDALEKKYNHE